MVNGEDGQQTEGGRRARFAMSASRVVRSASAVSADGMGGFKLSWPAEARCQSYY
jgi:hypothetical protein